MALYLKYRPQSLDELIGQETVKKILTNAFSAGKLSHAYLFVGPRGTGKTSTARILAKMVNCEGKGESEKGKVPCNKCPTCVSITDGSNLDLIEIDAASNRGIDDIRTLRENIKLTPSSAKKKVYIIDEVHMLTTEAFNALLKTLEEPPKHAIFILATTDLQKIPQTILSRVQKLDFTLAAPNELTQALQKIIESEKIEIEPEALRLIVRRAEGSFRDGVKLLDQLASSNNKITHGDVTSGLLSTEQDVSFLLLDLLAKKDVQESLKLVSSKKNNDIKNWIVSLMDISRSLLLVRTGVGEVLVEPEYQENVYEKLLSLAQKFTISDLRKLLDCLQEALEKLRFTSIPILPLELAVIEVCQGLMLKNEKSDVEKEIRSSDELQIIKIQTPVSNNDDVIAAEVFILQEKWNFVLETIKPYNFSLEALLRLVKILEYKDGTVVLEVPYSFHQRILEAPKSRDLLESVLSDILGKQTRVTCVLATQPMRAEDIANVDIAADDEVIKAAAEIFGS